MDRAFQAKGISTKTKPQDSNSIHGKHVFSFLIGFYYIYNTHLPGRISTVKNTSFLQKQPHASLCACVK